MSEVAKNLELVLPISLQDVLKAWARKAGFFDKSVPIDIQEKKYLDAIMGLFCMLAKHHEEMDDATFARAFRFFKDTGLTKRLSDEASISKRYAKLDHIEPDMIKSESDKQCLCSTRKDFVESDQNCPLHGSKIPGSRSITESE
jgi:hypothetical protein